MTNNNNTTQNTKLISNPKLGFWLNVATMYKQQSGITNHAELVHHLCKNGFAKHNAEINVGTRRALRHLRRYQWKHFRKWAPTYVLTDDKFAVLPTRSNPKRYSGQTRGLRIYLRSRQRDNPAPIMLRREGGIWKVYANSL